MFKPNDYESAQAFNGASEALTPGGHKCIILDAREQKSRAGNPMLVLSFDIAPGDDFAGYFKQKYQSAKHFRDDAKWPNAGIYRQLVTKKDGTTDEFFKGMITAIEESNPGFKFNFDEKTLKGKFFGGVFGREQFKAQDGSLKWSTKCCFIRSVDALKDVEPPKDKYMDGSHEIAGNAARAGVPVNSFDSGASHPDFTEIAANEDDLPF